MAKSTSPKGYGNDSISSLKGADRVRKRPAVIFGSDGLEGCEHAVFEILSNAIDEAREGHGSLTVSYTHLTSFRLSPQAVANLFGLRHHLRRVLGCLRLRLLQEAPGLGLRLGLGFRQMCLACPLSLRYHALGLRLGLRLAGLIVLLGLGHLLDRFH